MDVTEFYLAIVIGIVLSLLVEEFIGITCGGMIVPAYLSLLCDDLLSMIVVFLIAMVVYLIVEFVLPHFVVLFGKRKFISCLFVGLLLKLLADCLVPIMPFATLAFRGVGVITPGLIANTSAKQGVHITVPAVLIATYITYALVQLVMWVM